MTSNPDFKVTDLGLDALDVLC